MTTHIPTPSPTALMWPTVANALKQAGFAVQMRLIDGQLAFPDESPGPDWRELRVACEGRMVTIRRMEAGIDLVCWGNADEASLRFRDALAQAFSQSLLKG